MSANDHLNALGAELDRLRKERDDYRSTVADLLKKHYDIDLQQMEDEIRDLRATGGIDFGTALREFEAEFGLVK